jgi:hypothetical protein
MLLLAFAAAAPAPSCKVEDAHYVLRGTPMVAAWFHDVDSGEDWPSGLALGIHFGHSGRTLWWLPWNGGTDGTHHIASTTDVTLPGWRPPNPDDGPRPHGNVDYFGTDASYTLIDHVPERGELAPAHFLLPQLAQIAWNHGQDPTDNAPEQFFDLVACKPQAS